MAETPSEHYAKIVTTQEKERKLREMNAGKERAEQYLRPTATSTQKPTK